MRKRAGCVSKSQPRALARCSAATARLRVTSLCGGSVAMTSCASFWALSRLSKMRLRISAVALLLKVSATISSGSSTTASSFR